MRWISNLRHDPDPVNSLPRADRVVVFGLQHVLIMYSGAITVPLVVGPAIGLSTYQTGQLVNADLLVCGIATLVQSLGLTKWIGIKLPIIQGASFTAIAPMVAAAKGYGIPAMFGSLLVAGVFAFLVAPLFGKGRRFLPPLVTGTTMIIVGVSLVKSGTGLIAGQDATATDYASAGRLALAGGVLLLIILITRFFKGYFGQTAVLIGLVAGTLVAIPMGFVDFSTVADAPGFGDIVFFRFGAPTFSLSAIIPMLIAMLVILAETSAYIFAVGETLDRKITDKGLTKALRADAVGSVVGSALGGFASTTFSQNVGLLEMTGVKSRFTTAASGAILVILGFLPALGQIIASIPGPVVGAAAMIMFAMVSAVGVKSLRGVHYSGNHNILILAVALVAGMVPVAAPAFYHIFPSDLTLIMSSSITATLIVAFILNLLFNHPWRRDAGGMAGSGAAGPADSAAVFGSGEGDVVVVPGALGTGDKPQEEVTAT